HDHGEAHHCEELEPGDLLDRATGTSVPIRIDVLRLKNGTGLGLSIVQRIISSHKGKIFVDSKEGEGTEFTIELPKKGGENG
ncbi:MAG: ATP-binding protein, partial [candidate division WOR-3 bacterium]